VYDVVYVRVIEGKGGEARSSDGRTRARATAAQAQLRVRSRRLSIAVVGASGTGSPVVEQLMRLDASAKPSLQCAATV